MNNPQRAFQQQTFWIGFLTGIGVCLMLATTTVFALRFNAMQVAASEVSRGIGGGDIRKSRIRQWLRDNLNDGKWDEVSWLRTDQQQKEFMARIRFRSRNAFGAMSLSDEVFRFRADGRMEHLEGTIGEAYIFSQQWHDWSER